MTDAKDGADVFDFVGSKMATHLIESLEAMDGFAEPFRSGGIMALEEFWYRATGHHFDWAECKREIRAMKQEGR